MSYIFLCITELQVGFEETEVDVLESAGSVSVCVNVTQPDNAPIGVSFALRIQVQPKTASENNKYTETNYLSYKLTFCLGSKDYLAPRNQFMGFWQSHRRQCVQVSIMNDAISESTENFALQLIPFLSFLTNIRVDPQEITVHILDDDCELILCE